jgi:hypothetical protein
MTVMLPAVAEPVALMLTWFAASWPVPKGARIV